MSDNEWSNPRTHLNAPSPHNTWTVITNIFTTHHTRIPDFVQTMQNVRVIKLMAINELEEGWQGYMPHISSVISLASLATSHAQWSQRQDNVLSPFIPQISSPSPHHHLSQALSSFCRLSPGNPDQPLKEEENSYTGWLCLDAQIQTMKACSIILFNNSLFAKNFFTVISHTFFSDMLHNFWSEALLRF